MPDNAPGYTPPAILRLLPLRLAVAAIPAWITLALLIFSTPWSLKALIGLVLVTTLASPSNGLLLVAALVPLGQFLTMAMGLSGFRSAEAIVVTFLVGWLLHPGEDRPGPRMLGSVGWLLTICVVAS